jgi:hypothetical protein
MAECSMGCSEKVVGGFREIKLATQLNSPTTPIPSMKLYWCRTHEKSLRGGVVGMRGEWLSGKDLE